MTYWVEIDKFTYSPQPRSGIKYQLLII